MPKSIESYYQETGRAGRDGLPSEVLMLYGLQDVAMLWSMVNSSEADQQHKMLESRKVSALLGFCETTHCRRKVILEYFGEKVDADKHQCNNCDTCLYPVTNFDGTEVTKKAISAVFRTGQIFGAGHVIDNIIGKPTQKMTNEVQRKLS
jgi:ATP-dependent DNA helicase RecQ